MNRSSDLVIDLRKWAATPACLPDDLLSRAADELERLRGSGTKIVTAWYRDGEFNHMSIGFQEDHMEPAYITDEQRKAWTNQTWTPRKASLKNGKLYVEQ